MPRLMSVKWTADAVRSRSKTVTRRMGWWRTKAGHPLVRPGDLLTLCEQVQGLRSDQPLVRIATVVVVDVRREPLQRLIHDTAYGAAEMGREGVPEMAPADFIARFFAPRGLDYAEVTRIEWEYLDGDPS